MARVKCPATGEYGTSKTFYRHEDGKYYKSKEICEAFLKSQAAKKEALRIITDEIFGYETGRPYPVSVVKKYKELAFYDDEIILETVKEIRDSVIECCANKEFASEYNKAAYVFAAINNHVGDVYNRHKAMEKHQKQLERQAEKQVQFEINDFNEVPKQSKRPTYSQTRDISSFL